MIHNDAVSCYIFHTVFNNSCHSVLMLEKIEIMHKRNPQLLIFSLMPFPFNPELHVLSMPTLGADL